MKLSLAPFGFVPTIVCESDEPAAIRPLIRAGLGVAFLPASSWRLVPERGVVQLHIEEPDCVRTIGVAGRADRYLSLAARAFRQFVIDYVVHGAHETT